MPVGPGAILKIEFPASRVTVVPGGARKLRMPLARDSRMIWLVAWRVTLPLRASRAASVK